MKVIVHNQDEDVTPDYGALDAAFEMARLRLPNDTRRRIRLADGRAYDCWQTRRGVSVWRT